ncbi:MAG: PIN domain-containing protein [Abitibacteriaceae bacterium]|nr:PIN domain-containing protein [Abditibacteriaceae bacterium]
MTLINGSSTNGSRLRPKVCLETSVFAALFGHEDEKGKTAHGILHDAAEGRVQVVVSSLVLVECESVPGRAGEDIVSEADTLAASAVASDAVADFFESEFLTRCNVDPFTGELARRLRADLSGIVPLAPNAWLWLATALLMECDYLMTYDRRVHKLNGQAALGNLQVVPPARPWDGGQLSLADVEGVMSLAPGVGVVRSRTVEI